MRKKILFLIHDLGQGGAEKVLVNLVNNMDSEKYDITVMSLFGGGVNEKFLNKEIKYQVIFSKTFPGNSHLMKLYSPKRLHEFFIKEKYDIEISYLEGPCARIISGCSNKNTKLVSWIHVEQHTKECAAGAFRSYKESENCYKKFNKTICVSEAVKDDFMSLYPNVSDVQVLYNVNETDKILRLKDEPVEDNVFKDGEIRLCGVGKIMTNKGFDKLARIHKRLRDEGYSVHSYVLGDGPDREKIEKYLVEYGLEDSFTFLGYQTNPYKYVSKCDLFVCTSISEGFSTAATEALILGVPVLTTPVAGMKELIGEDNVCGIIAEQSEDSLCENITKLIDNIDVLKSYKKNAFMRGKDFSTKATVQAVESMLKKI